MSSTEQDRTLASEIAQGNEQAIEFFDKLYRSDLEQLARRRGLSSEDAKDMAQDTIIAAVRFIQSGRFRGESSLRTLVFVIFRNHVNSHFRRNKSEEQVRADSSSCHESSVALMSLEDVAAPVVKPDSKLITEEVLRLLPEGNRLILMLHEMWGFQIDEISSMIRRPKGSVGRMLAEAKQMFREKMR
jgi:RNA polymerase sigma factor (sigma-70 family)